MLGVLLESRARRQRRTVGAALSAAAHLALIGAATAATTHGPSRPEKPAQVVIVDFPPSVHPAPPQHASPSPLRSAAGPTASIAPVTVRTIEVPTFQPTDLPPIGPAPAALDSFVTGPRRDGPIGHPRGLFEDGDGSGTGEWRGAELLMRVLTSSKPRYPEPLRQAGISGHVLVRFTVDTLGRIDPASVRIVESTHDMFSNSVRNALPAFRFKPAEVAGRRVPALGEMPFEFQVTR